MWPELLLVATENSRPWPGYDLVPEAEPEKAGRYRRQHYLYRRNRPGVEDRLSSRWWWEPSRVWPMESLESRPENSAIEPGRPEAPVDRAAPELNAPVPLVDFLKEHYREPQPAWLDLACLEPPPAWLHPPGPKPDPVTRRAILEGFLRSRIVYYPDAGTYGQPVALFNSAHAAHAYVYVDYHIPRHELDLNLRPDGIHLNRGFLGYRLVCALDFQMWELTPHGYTSRFELRGWDSLDGLDSAIDEPPYAALYVYERLPGFGEEHGARRFAVLAILADGFAAYEALSASRVRLHGRFGPRKIQSVN